MSQLGQQGALLAKPPALFGVAKLSKDLDGVSGATHRSP
jgi:hypothetical protein